MKITETYEAAKSKRVALVHDWLTVPGGSETVLQRIANQFTDAIIFTSVYNKKTFTGIDNFEVETGFIQDWPFAKTGRHYLYAPFMPTVYRAFDLSDFDLIISDSHSFAHHVQTPKDSIHVCYYHTPARSLWVPEIDDRASGGLLGPLKWLIARRLRKLDLEASCNPEYIIANSQTTAARISKFYGRTANDVIFPPVDVEEWFDVASCKSRAGLLYWGRLISYKRVDLIISAARQIDETVHIVGSGPDANILREQARGLENVTFHGRLESSALKQLMSECRAVVFPGYEDFGIVPVEALAAGLPVIYYGQGGATESVPDGFGVPFKQQQVNALVDAIRASAQLSPSVEAMRSHAWRFRPERFDRQFAMAIDRAYDSKRPTRQ